MQNVVHIYNGIGKLNTFLYSSEISKRALKSQSILVQVFSAQNNVMLLKDIVKSIQVALPKAEIIGTTTVGEISNGYLKLGQIILSFSFFDFAKLELIVKSCSENNEIEIGKKLIEEVLSIEDHISGLLLFATPITTDVSKIFIGMSTHKISFPVFGGGAGIYNTKRNSVIFKNGEFITHGVIGVVFLGAELQIYTRSNLGWQPLSKEMRITKSDGMVVKTIDNIGGFELYQKYLNIKNDDRFFQNVLEFPFLFDRGGYTVARIPLLAHKDNSIEFIADINEGEKFRIGYGDPDSIIRNAKEIHKAMFDFRPQAIFIYACITRRFLMQNDVNLETHPFDYIAPTTGFFTYGEFFSYEDKIKLLNCTIVAVGMREGEIDYSNELSAYFAHEEYCKISTDLYSDNHNRILSKLLYFISKQTSELEAINKELVKLSEIDKLTQIYNRMKLDTILNDEITKGELFSETFSVVIMDVDHFKDVNDRYGHLIGDRVLIELADILKTSIRGNDFVGRWGGEEFLIILPKTQLKDAIYHSEKIRNCILSHSFLEKIRCTCSFGVSAYCSGDSRETLIQRADSALYKAKNGGRNKVEYLQICDK